MADQTGPAEALARPIIQQCRREIAAAWVQVEAAKEVLRRGRWLLAHWAERSRIDESSESARLNSSDRSEAARIGMFVLADADIHRHRRQRNRSVGSRSIFLKAASHTHLRSASG
jgi:hypothetical protein